ncbi:hypothetical protein LSCM1_02004 [Leishmania martiniquensis]|uniref:Uncharacterized protein n=1 Tax=Leishmania martiniquensis TaxID=1580590 RepID=A0A836H5G8_9TRYP|nr:hypothetical protein LSCM1_02004 [Leishmania martiniquensis]
MEELLAAQLAELREEQERLEKQLGHTVLGVPLGTRVACSATAATEMHAESRRCVRELSSHEASSATTAVAGAAASTAHNVDGHTRESPERQNEADLGRSTPPPPATTEGAAHVKKTCQERLGELESLKRKYEAYARKAMNEYFSAVGDYQGYKERREKSIRHVKPFTFESRELVKPPRIREQRAEADQRARDAPATEYHQRPYKATPVPPSTFMNKYELMVEEWCQRKAAIEMMSRERARIAKEDAAFVRLSAQGLRSTREELMGVIYGPDGKPVARNELRRRAQSVDCTADRRKDAGAPLHDAPIEVFMRLWPAISDHERLRRQRIKFLASLRRSEVDAEVRKAMPLLTSPSPARCYTTDRLAGMDINALLAAASSGNAGAASPLYGVGQAVLPLKPHPLPVAEAGAPAAAPLPSTVAPPLAAGGASPALRAGHFSAPPAPTPQLPACAETAAPPSVPPSSVAVVETPSGASAPLPLPLAPAGPLAAPPPPLMTSSAVPPPAAAVPLPVTTAPVAASVSAGTVGAAARLKAARESAQRGREATLRRYNPHLTFKPNVQPGVPNFEALWAQDKLALAEKKRQYQTTVPEPFALTASARDTKIVGRRAARSASALGPPRRHRSLPRSKRQKETGTPPMPATAAAELPSSRSGAPRGTRAHALRTQAIYSHYVQQSEERSSTVEGDAEYWKAVAQRQREVRKRLSAYLIDQRAEHERAIREKVRALRAAMRENEEAAMKRLAEMKQKVAEMPPVFAEPLHLNEQSKARVEAEKSILKSLKEAGLDGATIKRILASSPVASADAVADVVGAGIAGASGSEDNGVPPKAAGEEDSKPTEAQPIAAANSPASDPLKAPKHEASDSSSSTSSSTSSTSSSNKSPPGSTVAKGSSRQSISSLPVPVPKPGAGVKQDTSAYSDDSFESSDSD